MKLRTFFFSLLAVASGGAATIYSEDFNSSPSDPNTLGWYSSSNGTNVFSAASGALQFAASDTTVNQSAFRQFTETSVGVGQVLTVKMTVTALTSASDQTHIWRLGLYDTSNTFASNQGASPWAGANEGYQLTITTDNVGGTSTNSSNLNYKPNATGILSTGGTTAISTVADRIPASGGFPLELTLSVSRIASNQVIVNATWLENGTNLATFTSPAQTSDTRYVDKFDTIYFGYGVGAVNRGFTIDDVSVTLDVIPEPSHALLSLCGIAFLGIRRRR